MKFFLIYLNLFSSFKIKNGFYILRADVEERSHVAIGVHATWQRMCVCAFAHARTCVRTCVRVCN